MSVLSVIHEKKVLLKLKRKFYHTTIKDIKSQSKFLVV